VICLIIKYNRKAIGKILQAARKAKGITQDKAAELAGCSLRHLVQIEGGTTGLSTDLMLSLCSAYSITPNDIFLEDLGFKVEGGAVYTQMTVLLSTLTDKEKQIALELLNAYAHGTHRQK
jgi:transcriptional regulator with XRE-family HTH domain